MLLSAFLRVFFFFCFYVVVCRAPLNNGVILFNSSGVSMARFHMDGDLMIGLLVPITKSSSIDTPCNNGFSMEYVEHVLLIASAIDSANQRNLFNGTRIGLTAYDMCGNDAVSLAQALRFLPRNESQPPFIGLICCTNSAFTTMVSSLTTVFKIPQISTFASSDALSDKGAHKYFLRLAPPDRLQVQAMISLLRYFGWNYVSVLYAEGSYGENFISRFEAAAKDNGLCIAFAKRITTRIDVKSVVDQLVKSEAHTVVLVMQPEFIGIIFQEILQRNLTSRFMWLGADAWGANMLRASYHREVGIGGIALSPKFENPPDVMQIVRNLSSKAEWKNDWWQSYHKSKLQCLDVHNASDPCSHDRLYSEETAAIFYDSIDVFIQGLQQYLPQIGWQHSRFSNADFLQVLTHLKFEGKNGPVQFDHKSDLVGTYVIRQLKRGPRGFEAVPVGEWHSANHTLIMNLSLVEWPTSNGTKPVSVCSQPCGIGEIMLRLEPACCWKCVTCRQNEITDLNQTKCEQCAEFTWPENETHTSCVNITLTYIEYDSALGIVVLVVSGVGAVLTLSVIIIFARNNDKALVKATCREASYLLLSGIIANFAATTLLIGPASDTKCLILRLMFHLVCTFTYAPILIKTVKIFRIFITAQRSAEPLKFISPMLQLAVIVILIIVEAAIVAMTLFMKPPKGMKIMSDRLIESVEFTCDESLETILTGLAFNFLLILCCAVLAVMARKLPENYNESLQIIISVYTTLILWIVLIPSYLTTPHAYRKVMLLAIAMEFNGYVPLLSLFCPKIYALYYVAEDRISFSALRKRNGSMKRHSHSHTTKA